MNYLKRIAIAAASGAAIGAVAAAKVDVGLFRKWLRENGFGPSLIQNFRAFDWKVALGRWLDGALAGAGAAIFAALGIEGLQ